MDGSYFGRFDFFEKKGGVELLHSSLVFPLGHWNGHWNGDFRCTFIPMTIPMTKFGSMRSVAQVLDWT